MIQISDLKQFALSAYHSQIAIDKKSGLLESFLLSLKLSQEAKPLFDAVQNAVEILFEAGSDYAVYRKIASQIMDGVVKKFSDNGGGREMTKKLCDVINGVRGKVTVNKIGGGLISSFVYSEGNPTKEDAENAKMVLMSSVFPYILRQAFEIEKRTGDPESGMNLIVAALDALPQIVSKFQFRESSFLNWYVWNLKNEIRSIIADSHGIAAAEQSFKVGGGYNKGRVVSFNGQNWRAIQDIQPYESNDPPMVATHQWEPYGITRKGNVSWDAPDENGDGVGERVASDKFTSGEIENKGELSRLMRLIQPSKEKEAIEQMYGLHGTPKRDVEVAETMGISRGQVHALVKKGLDQIRSKANIEMPQPTEA